MVLSRPLNSAPYRSVEKFKYLGIEYSSDGKQGGEIDRRISVASAVFMLALPIICDKDGAKSED